LEKGRTIIADCPELFLEGCRVEEAAGKMQASRALMAKALQKCPDSGLLHAHGIFMESKVGDSPLIALADSPPHLIAIADASHFIELADSPHLSALAGSLCHC
jgi:hypothetical protein